MGTDSEATRGIDRRTALAALAAGGVATAASTGVGAAKPGKGAGNGPKKGGCDIAVPDDHATIQAAVDAADDGDTVCVADGTYAEQVVIDKSLTLRSAEGASPTIEPADAPRSFTIPESGPAWEPMVFAYGGTESGGDVSGADTVDVTVSGFTLDGRSEQPDARRKPAVLFRNASGAVSENTVENMGVGGKETFGILAYGDSEVAIVGNTVSEYERGGIGANGDGGAHPSPAVQIRRNDLTGSTGLGEAWGPNGIQVGFGATGDIRRNAVADHRYSDEEPVASGILVFESDGVRVQRNEVTNADIGLSCGSWGWLQQSASNNKFTQNHVEDVEYGALVESVAEPYGGVLTKSDPEANDNKIVGNTLTGESDPDGNIGVGVIVEDNIDNEYEPVAWNNKLINNDIANFETAVEDQGTDTKVAPFDP
jgi:nitrous oxidase accessory protein NosD